MPYEIPYCTIKMYQKCFHKLLADDYTTCRPNCITMKNQYDFSVQKANNNYCTIKENGTYHCSEIVLSVYCDMFYVINEEKFQLTMAQFISQLGGDIGLYTGLSMLSVLKFILFVYNRYKKNKKNSGNNQNPSVGRWKRLKGSLKYSFSQVIMMA